MGDFLTVDEAATRLGIPEATLRQWIKKGWARTSRRGGAHYIRDSEVERLRKNGPASDSVEAIEPSSEAPVRLAAPPPPAPLPEPVVEEAPDRFLISRRERLAPRPIEHSGERSPLAPRVDNRAERLEREVSELRQDRDELVRRVQELEVLLAQREGELSDLSDQIHATATSRGEDFEQRLREADSQIERLRDENRRLREDQHELESARGRMLTELENVRVDLGRLRSERDRLQSGYAKVEEVHEEVIRLTAERDRLIKELQRAEQDRARAADQGRSQSESAQALAEQVARLEADLSIEQTERRRLEVEFDKLKAEAADRQAELDELERLREDLRTVQKTALKLETERARLINEAAGVRSESEDAERRVQDAEERRAQAEEDLRVRSARYEEEIRHQAELLQRAQGRVETLEAHLQSVEKRQGAHTASIMEENRRLREEMKNVQMRLSLDLDRPPPQAPSEDTRNLTARLTELESAMAEKDRVVEEAFRDRSELRNQLEAYKQHYYELQQRYEREKNEWSALVAHEFQRRGNETMMQNPPPASGEKPQPGKPKGWGLFKPRSEL